MCIVKYKSIFCLKIIRSADVNSKNELSKQRSAKKGFSLLEALVSLAIIAIILLAVSKTLITYVHTSKSRIYAMTATTLAQNKLDEYELRGDLSVGNFEGIFVSNPDYRWKVAVSNSTNERLLSLKRIKVEVLWNENQISRDFVLESLLYLPQQRM